MASRFVMKDEVATETFDWGTAGMRGAPTSTGCDTYVVMDVVLAPGFAHAFHKHPDQDEMIVVKQGRVVQWLEHEHRELGPGDSDPHRPRRRARLVQRLRGACPPPGDPRPRPWRRGLRGGRRLCRGALGVSTLTRWQF